MNQYDLFEQEIKDALVSEVNATSRELDQRMNRHLRSKPQLRRRASWDLWRPALTAASLALAVGLGYFFGTRQAPYFGPQMVENAARPALVASTDEAPALALYELANQLNATNVLRYSSENRMPLASEPMVAPTLKAADDAASTGDTDAGGVAQESSASAPSATAAPPADVQTLAGLDSTTAAEDEFAGLFAPNASLGFAGSDVFMSEGNSVLKVAGNGERSFLNFSLKNPKGVAVDKDGRVFVTEYLPNGALVALGKDGEVTTIRAGLNYPAGIAFATDQSLYLAEQGRGRVLRFLPQGETVTPQSLAEVFATGFSGLLQVEGEPSRLGGPFALTVTVQNELLVSDLMDGKVVIFRFSLTAESNWWDRLWPKSQ